MGVVNVTPDSFSDGGQYITPELAVAHALSLEHDGADILDIGGESTRPGAASVGLNEELARVIPVIEAIRKESECPISVDTTKPEVMVEALAAGADMINDVNALRADGAIEALAPHAAPVVLMHMQGQPRTMQHDPQYGEVVADIKVFLAERVATCVAGGIAPGRIILDPGFGFGKTLAHNIALLARLDELVGLGQPILAGLSRKSMLGAITGRQEPQQRQAASLSAALLAAQAGATIIRVHDVAETLDVLKVWAAVKTYDDGNKSQT